MVANVFLHGSGKGKLSVAQKREVLKVIRIGKPRKAYFVYALFKVNAAEPDGIKVCPHGESAF